MSRWRALLRAPLVHFLVLGGLLVLAEARLAPIFAPPPTLQVDAGRLRVLAEDYRRLHGVDPDTQALDAQVRAWVDEELKVREARRRGLARGDLVIRRRLNEQMGLLSGSPETVSESGFEGALELGLDATDPIARRRLTQLLDQEWARELGPFRPEEGALRAHLEAEAERFLTPARARVSHLFFAGPRAEERARSQLAWLQSAAPESSTDSAGDQDFRRLLEGLPDRGDAFALGSDWPLRNRGKLEQTLGPEATDLAFQAPLRTWVGPVESAWGEHLLFVHQRQEPALPTVEELRPQLLRSLGAEHTDRYIEQQLEQLRQQFRVVVAELEPSHEEEGP